MHRYVLLIFMLMLLESGTHAQTVPTGLVEAIQKGDAKAMSDYFHQSLEISILEKDHMASKNQATRIMEDFFKAHPPTAFSISFEGAKEDSKYAIGALSTKDANYRINLFFMLKEDKRLVYYLSIEKESEYELYP